MQHQLSHLGQYPYRLLDAVQASEPTEMNPKPGSACDHCGTYITNIFICQSADGKKFNLGSSCVDKLGDKGLIDQVKAKQRELRRQKREAQRHAQWLAEAPMREAAAKERAEAAVAEEAEWQRKYEAVKPVLSDLQHPNWHFAQNGKTMLDYAEYFNHGQIRENYKLMQIINQYSK